MATYVVLNRFTDQGIRALGDTTKRADAIRQRAEKLGVTVKEIYWTLGDYDIIDVFEAPDDATMAAVLASIGASGNVRTTALRAFSQGEMDGILAKMKS